MLRLKKRPRYDEDSNPYMSDISFTVSSVVVSSDFISIIICLSISSLGETAKMR